jgi:hypothetical protein
MISRNEEVKKEIDTVNQDLSATRAHAPDEGTMLKGEVIDGLVEVGRCTTDTVNTYLEWCSSHINRPLSRACWRNQGLLPRERKLARF